MSRLLIADDHDLVRSTLAVMLREKGGYDVIEGSDMWGAMKEIHSDAPPDIALLDFSMPGMSIPETPETSRSSDEFQTCRTAHGHRNA